jgi:hypothetical protein
MEARVKQLLDQMQALEDELAQALKEQQSTIYFEIKGKKIEFEQSLVEAQRKLKKSFFHWLVTYRPQNLITGPIIYAMIVPLFIVDVFVTLYQWSCFPIYGIKRVPRNRYIVFDRHHLSYLNFIEKFHCAYCEYANGMVAYITEVLARTEQYFCPIKHARKLVAPHSRYARFIEYGEAVDYEAKLEAYRQQLEQEKA